ILSDLCAAFVGGLGFVPSANLGEHCAVFEAVHGSAPDIAGKNLANPTALLRSALLMVRHLGEHDASTQLRNALERVYRHREKLLPASGTRHAIPAMHGHIFAKCRNLLGEPGLCLFAQPADPQLQGLAGGTE